MKTKIGLLMIVFLVAIANLNAQDVTTNETDEDLLGLPGDNLDLYAVLNLFQESKTIEEFEKSLNEEETGINNLDLNLDDKVDFIKVETKQDGTDFVFILQVDVLEGEIQDVAVILVSKGDDKKVTIQIVGDESLYGKDYVIEPKSEAPAITANPAYSGPDTVVIVSEPATVIVVESEPIVQYVYSPVYAPYYPPYYYGYYPVYYTPYPVISINIYFGNNRHHHNNYNGGRNNNSGNTVVINNNNNYNSYNNTRNTSNTVNRNTSNGNYRNKDASNRPSKDAKTNNDRQKPNNNNNNIKDNKVSVPSTKQATKPAAKPASKPATKPAARPASKSKSKSKSKRKRR